MENYTRDPEYDRFGPWILEISETDPLPPLFVPHITSDEKPVLSIKIPRKIDRRDAAPGWNLYDYVINMYEDYFQIWERAEKTVRTTSFKYEDVLCIKILETLLLGSLTVITAGETYSFSYNTVSSDIIRKAASIIRERYNKNSAAVEISETDCPHKNELDFYFTGLLEQEEKNNPGIKLLFCQKRIALGKLEKNLLKKLLYRAASVDLLESLHFSSGRELKIISRGRAFKHLFHPLYGKEEVWVPLIKLKDAAVENKINPLYAFISLKTDNCILKYYASADNYAFPVYEKTLKHIIKI